MPYSDKRAKKYIGIGALIIVLIFLNFFGWLTPLKNFCRYIFLRPTMALYQMGQQAANNYQFLFNKNEYIQSYEQLLSEKRKSDLLTSQIEILKIENEQLKKQISFKQTRDLSQLSTKIIGKDIEGTEQSVMIEGGRRDGLKVGQPVIVEDGLLVGKISKVEENIAFVRLLSDNQNKVAATILNKDKSLGVVEGGYGISIKMNFIPRNEIITVGNQIVTSGLEENMPRGLLIGTVVAVENEAYQPFQKAILAPTADLSKLNLVSVLLTN